MIKDIGTDGLRVLDVAPPNHIYDSFNNGEVVVLPEGCEMEMIDVTHMGCTEQKYIPGVSGRQVVEHITESTGPR